MIVDAKDLIVGRFATKVAKAAMLGESIDIINCEKAIVTGTPAQVLERFRTRVNRGTPAKGPFFPRKSHLFVKRMIRGMIPYKKSRGREAYARVKCHIGVPAQFEGKPAVSYKEAHVEKLPVLRYTTVSNIIAHLGGKK